MAFFSLSKARIEHLVYKKRRFSHIAKRLRSAPQRLLITILLLNNLVNISASLLASNLFENAFGSQAIGIVTGVMTFLILVFGEIVPKSFAQIHAERYALWAAPFIQIIFWILYPIVLFLELITGWSRKRTKGSSAILYKEELKAMLHVGVKEHQIDKYERELIERSLRFDDLKVKQIMTAWKKVVRLDGDTQISKIAFFVSNSEHTRFPVYLKKEENVIGFVHVKNILAAVKSNKRDEQLQTISTPIEIVLNTMMIEALFYRMKKYRFRICLVKNKKENIVGLVTMRDLTEEIIGDYPSSLEEAPQGKAGEQ
jgi:CBS domain containing-hemolysin-like protein